MSPSPPAGTGRGAQAAGFRTLRVSREPGILRVALHRPERSNSIDPVLIAELHAALDLAEAGEDCRLVVIEGSGGVFSTGMDLVDAGGSELPDEASAREGAERFLGLLRRFTTVPRIVVAKVDGQAAGGGVGLAAAADFVYATERSRFSLPEALWGLLPCCVAPFLIRRTGFQKAYAMTLSTQPVDAQRAASFQLVDEVADDPEPLVRRLAFRSSKLDGTTLGDLKRYYRRQWFLTDEHERAAVEEFARLITSDGVRARLEDFAQHQRLPWEARR
ncbi:enoyl-CoA hydratase-related protein [Streptomyces sp. KLOTTS4A1]|uniref:enoyl-CoA hydratase-related protein n=1 Tax=Streptomyces sp. KLOTTS4A1 TaxID=3390996 RepID=UPI0039F4A0FF